MFSVHSIEAATAPPRVVYRNTSAVQAYNAGSSRTGTGIAS